MKCCTWNRIGSTCYFIFIYSLWRYLHWGNRTVQLSRYPGDSGPTWCQLCLEDYHHLREGNVLSPLSTERLDCFVSRWQRWQKLRERLDASHSEHRLNSALISRRVKVFICRQSFDMTCVDLDINWSVSRQSSPVNPTFLEVYTKRYFWNPSYIPSLDFHCKSVCGWLAHLSL